MQNVQDMIYRHVVAWSTLQNITASFSFLLITIHLINYINIYYISNLFV